MTPLVTAVFSLQTHDNRGNTTLKPPFNTIHGIHARIENNFLVKDNILKT